MYVYVYINIIKKWLQKACN